MYETEFEFESGNEFEAAEAEASCGCANPATCGCAACRAKTGRGGCAACAVARPVLAETEAMELAAELLSLGSEAELEHFLGKIFKGVGGLIKKGVGAIGRFAKKGISALGKGLKAVGKIALPALKGLAKVGLPMLGKVAGGFFGGPLGSMLGSKLGSLAGNLIGNAEAEGEMEGMSHEDREFEIARRYCHMVANSARNLLRRPASRNPERAALVAMTGALRGIPRRSGAIRVPMTARRPIGRRVAVGRSIPVGGGRGRWVRTGPGMVVVAGC